MRACVRACDSTEKDKTNAFHRARNMGIIIPLYWLRVLSSGSTSIWSFASIFFRYLFEAWKSFFVMF